MQSAVRRPKGEPAQRLDPDRLPPEWSTGDFEPLRAIGDKWIRKKISLAFKVPSAALPLEWNVLLNPLHPSIAQVGIEPPQPFHFDARIFGRRAR